MMMRLQSSIFLMACWTGAVVFETGCVREASTTRPASQPVTLAPTRPPGEDTQAPAKVPRRPSTRPVQPASQPASKPTSKPTPKLEVISLGPDGKEANWIVVEKWADGIKKGRVAGRWVRPNKMEIDVNGAEQVVLKLGRLPIRSGKRIVLRIEDARMELKRSLLPTVRLRRSPTGTWSAVRDK